MTELLSEYISNITYSQTLVQDVSDAFSLNSDELVPQMTMDHAVLEADKNNTLAFDHPDYDISSSSPDEEYLNKVHRLAIGGYKDISRSEELFDVNDMRQRNNWEGADSVYDAWLLSNNTPRKWFPYKKCISMFPERETQREYNEENLGQCSQSTPIKEGKFDFNDTMTSLSENLSSSVIESASENENQNSSFSDNETLPDSPIKENVSDDVYNSYVQRNSARSNHLRAMTENLTLLKMVEILRQMIQKEVLRRRRRKAAEEEQDINLQTDSKRKATIFYPLKAVKEVIVI